VSDRAVRRGSIVSVGRWCWLVWNVTQSGSVTAFPIGPPDHQRRHDVELTSPADQLLAAVIGTAVIQTTRPRPLRGSAITWRGELSGQAQCQVSVALVRLARDRQDEERWTAERRHRNRGFEERCAL
jgi:hypothetical protein